jgi:ABC-2 type transport system permease protein
MRTVTVYGQLIAAQVRAQASYRGSFAIDLVSQAAVTLFEIGTVIIFFGVTKSLGGFSFAPAMLVSGLALTCFRIGDMVAGGMDQMSTYVRRGQLDAMLVRPLSGLGQVFVDTLEIRTAGAVAQAVVVLVIALVINDIDWTPVKALVLVLSVLSGAVSIAAIFVAGGTFTFWFVDAREISNAFTYGGRDFTTYPITIYGPAFRVVFAFVVPLAFVAYYPALTLLDRADRLGMPPWFGYLSPVAAVALATAATLFWRVGIRHYRGTGS